MFARSALRTFQAAAPLKQAAARRCYSTGGSPGSGSSSKPALISAAVLAAAGGAYYLSSSGNGKEVGAAVAKAEAKAEAKAKEVVAKAKEAVAEATASSAAGSGPKVAFTGGDQGFVSLELEAAEAVNHNTKLLRFKLPDAEAVSGMAAASALLTKFRPEGQTEDGKPRKPVVRPYTAVATGDEATDRGHLDLLVKRYEGGAMSTHLHELQPGERLDVKGPIVKYAWAPNKHEHIALVAGGTGITPMYQLAQAVFQRAGEDRTKVTLVFANVAEEDILLRKEFAELENTYPRQFRAFYVLEKPPAGWADKQSGQAGYISKELLKQVLPEPQSGDIKVFVCGPPGMMKAISGPKKSPSDQGELGGILKELGYTADQVLKL